MFSSLLLVIAAARADVYAGIPIDALAEDFSPPRFQSARLGYTRDFKKGLARVYVGPSERAAAEWQDEMAALVARQKPSPIEGLGDEAVGSGDSLVLLRAGNVGLMVEAAQGARVQAEALLATLVRGPEPWPEPLPLTHKDGVYTVPTDAAPHVSWTGGRLDLAASTPPGAPLQFEAPPRRVVTWDRFGRAAVQDYDASGQPVATPQGGPTAPTRSGAR